MTESTGTVLVASSPARDTDYAAWLDDWTVTTVEDSDELVEAVRPDVALVLLDRDLIDGDPESLLDDLRAMGIDRPIVGLSDDSESPTGLGSRFSEELERPVAESTLVETVETMADRPDEAVQKQEYLALAASQAAMEIELSPAETDDDETYEQVTSRIEELRRRIDVPLEEFEDELADSLT